ncbi:MAG: hypothetical protein RBS37_07455 [Bacteroidales bacterium]|jgi:hypothetical protein|nr:hypothetical protein [Bacteroidales bacterium]
MGKLPAIKREADYPVMAVATIIVFILLGSVLVYGLNIRTTGTVFFSMVIAYYLTARDNVQGFVLVFILILNPWGLFYYRPYEWFIPLTSTVGLSYKTMLVLTILAREFYLKRFVRGKLPDNFRTYYLPVAFYLIFLLSLGMVFGYNSKSLYETFTSLPVWLLFFIIPRKFNMQELLRFNKIVFLFAIVHHFVSVVDILTSGVITNTLIFGREASTAALWGDELIRLTGGIGIAFYSVITGLYYIASKNKNFNPWYLWLVILFSLFYIMNSGTRGWIIAMGVLLILFAFFFSGAIFSRKSVLVGVIAVAFAGWLILPAPVKTNIGRSFTRLTTVESIAEGDLSAGGTAGRWTVRGPRVLTRFNESPVVGFGFSRVSSDYYDGHVGNHVLLLMGGVTGLTLVWGTMLIIIFRIYMIDRSRNQAKGLFVFGLGLVAIMVIHSTSRVMVAFRMPSDSAFIIALMLNHVNALLADIGIAVRSGMTKKSFLTTEANVVEENITDTDS